MRNVFQRKFILLPFIAAFIWLIFTSLQNPPVTQQHSAAQLEYSILKGSRIAVLGSTNINEFTCFSEETYAKQKVEFTLDEHKTTMQFSHAMLKVPVASLDCGNVVMNSNLCRTLKSDNFPYIIVELKEARSKDGSPMNLSNLTQMIAKVDLTLGGVRKTKEIRFSGKQVAPGHYSFNGLHNLSLKEYNLETPAALFGLIKVADDIGVKFNLNVSATIIPADKSL
ncbi:MAG: hypothetical protein K1X61_04150 [Chitinophagales bacterium]|nr:hypothetical protein [Chitinophagales bacterium]